MFEFPIKVIDTHAHIYSESFEGTNSVMIQRAVAAGVHKIVMPNVDIDTVESMLAIERAFPSVCYPAIGLHPCDVKENYIEQLQQLNEYRIKHRFYAIGEIGIDLHWDLTFKQQQFKAFETQIAWALESNLPILIHSRNANREAIDIVTNFKKSQPKGIFHCFSGNMEIALEMIDLGFYLGIGGVITFKNSGLDLIIKEIPLEHIVLETDAPYLAPVPYRGKLNEPSFLPLIAQKIADIKQIPLELVVEKTNLNAQAIFNFN